MLAVFQVSKSGYYDWLKASEKPDPSHQLVEAVVELHKKSRGTYGSRRIREDLREAGIAKSRKTIIKLMRLGNVQGRRKTKTRRRADSTPSVVAPNLVNRKFYAQLPNQCWVGDITTVTTAEGPLNLATFLDLYSRRIVGWSMSANLESSLVVSAFRMACAFRGTAPRVVHSDRGTQYGSADFRQELAKHPICRQSMSRRANCLDNAVAESFFATLKKELVYGAKFHTLAEARSRIFEYIECFYNQIRRHSFLDYTSPNHFEESFGVA